MVLAKIKHWTSPKKLLALTLLIGLVGVGVLRGAAHAQSITQGYATDESLQRGIIVMQKKDDPTKVVMLNSDDGTRMLGVTVNANDSPITLSGDGNKVFVATDGRYDVLVTDQNGSIEVGDFITISAIEGLGMKAGPEQALILGKAYNGFNGSTGVLSTGTITDSAGKERTVKIGRIQVDIAVGRNPLVRNEAAVPSFLKKATVAIAGKEVSAGRIYTSIVVFLLTASIAGAVMYAGIHSSIIAVGRNPLGRKGIMKSMFQVILTSLIIFIIGVFGVYLLLKV